MRTFNILFFTDSLKRFIESLDYFCIAYDACFNLASYSKPLSTILVCLIGLITILWYEIAIGVLLTTLGIFSIYNKFHKRVHTPPKICYSRNIQFLQNLIDFIAILKSNADKQIDECLFWSKPEKALKVLKVLLLGGPVTYLALTYLPLRYGVGFAWVASFVYLSDFGRSFCASVVQTLRLNYEVW